jgi:hypothetical protein
LSTETVPREGLFIMPANVLAIVLTVLSGVALPAFGYLRYRAYTATVRHVVDRLGVDGLYELDKIAPPDLPRRLPARRRRRPAAPDGGARTTSPTDTLVSTPLTPI